MQILSQMNFASPQVGSIPATLTLQSDTISCIGYKLCNHNLNEAV